MTSPTIGVLHPGQMGAALATQARRNHVPVLWCPSGRGPNTLRRAEDAGLTASATLQDFCDQSDVILSICPPVAAEAVADAVAGCGFSGIYVEANAINPARFAGIHDRLKAAEHVLDAAVIGPPPTDQRGTTLYLAGDSESARLLSRIFAETSVQTVYLAAEAPAASALKMAYASYQKASRVLAAVSHALARNYGVTEHLLTEGERIGQSPLADPGYIPSVAARAWRWGPEMRDAAQTLLDNDLPGELAMGAADVLDRWKSDKDASLTTSEALNHLTQKQNSR